VYISIIGKLSENDENRNKFVFADGSQVIMYLLYIYINFVVEYLLKIDYKSQFEK